MKVIETNLPGVLIIEPQLHGDARGFFLESFHEQRYSEAGISLPFVQDNQSRSRKGVLRGLHFQKTKPQGKLVRVSAGEVFDVAVDINPDSATYGQWTGTRLTSEKHNQMYVPPGYAHGFLVLSEYADFQYKCTAFYDPGDEGGVRWDDPDIGVEWPLIDAPLVSEKDQQLPSLKDLTS